MALNLSVKVQQGSRMVVDDVVRRKCSRRVDKLPLGPSAAASSARWRLHLGLHHLILPTLSSYYQKRARRLRRAPWKERPSVTSQCARVSMRACLERPPLRSAGLTALSSTSHLHSGAPGWMDNESLISAAAPMEPYSSIVPIRLRSHTP